MVERTVLGVLSLCQLGRVEEARSVASTALKRDDTRVYRQRLENSCVGRAAAPEGDGSGSPEHQ
jgi:hypothetical protein